MDSLKAEISLKAVQGVKMFGNGDPSGSIFLQPCLNLKVPKEFFEGKPKGFSPSSCMKKLRSEYSHCCLMRAVEYPRVLMWSQSYTSPNPVNFQKALAAYFGQISPYLQEAWIAHEQYCKHIQKELPHIQIQWKVFVVWFKPSKCLLHHLQRRCTI